MYDLREMVQKMGIDIDTVDFTAWSREELEEFVETLEELQDLGSAVEFQTKNGVVKLHWRPQERQAKFFEACGLDPTGVYRKHQPQGTVIGFGGAAGGGKSDALLGLAAYLCMHFPNINVGYFRRQMTTLEQMGGPIDRSKIMFNSVAEWSSNTWTFPTGGRLRFAHLNNESSVLAYKSTQFDVILFDEGTQFTRFQYRFMISRNRATIDNFIPFMAIATNPGDIGHMWFKNEFVIPGAPEVPHSVEVEPLRFENHVFIPSKLTDNQILMRRDPDYERKLDALPEKERKMYKDGDWDVFEGQFFSEFNSELHVVAPFPLPKRWRRYRTLDYGLDMLAVYWIAVAPSGTQYVYRELCMPDLIASAAAKAILDATPADEDIQYTAVPPDLWGRGSEKGFTTVEHFVGAGLTDVMRTDNNRVEGWRAVREHLKPVVDEFGDIGTKLVIFENCTELRRCLPELQHDPKKPEDCMINPHDITHSPDAIRYGIMSRPHPKSITTDIHELHFKTRLEKEDYMERTGMKTLTSGVLLAPKKAGRATR